MKLPTPLTVLRFHAFPCCLLLLGFAALLSGGCGDSEELSVSTSEPKAPVRLTRDELEQAAAGWSPSQQELLNKLGFFDREAVEWVFKQKGSVTQAGNVLQIDLQNTSVGNDLRPLKFLESPVALNVTSLPLGDEGARHIAAIPGLISLSLAQTKITDKALEALADAEYLNSLNLGNTAITDRGLRWLRGLKNLNQLILFNTDISGAGVESLVGLEKLAQLDVHETKVTSLEGLTQFPELTWLSLAKLSISDSDLAPLGKATKLQQLYLAETKVGDRGLVSIRPLKSLQWLDLTKTRTTDTSLQSIALLTELSVLSLANTRITDAGVKNLAELKKLGMLDLSNNAIGDAALAPLTRLPLRRLGLLETKVSAAKVNSLRNLLPNCQIADPFTVAKRDQEDDVKKLLPGGNPATSPLKPKAN